MDDVNPEDRLRYFRAPESRIVLSATSLAWVETEPSLDELLADPIVQLMMHRDGVDMTMLIVLLHETRRRIMNL